MTEPSQLSELSREQRETLIHRLHLGQDSLCYICGKIINLQVHQVDIDHIIARSRGGADDETNWAVAHQEHNRAKGSRDLLLQRHIYRFREHVQKYSTATQTTARHFTVHEALQEIVPQRQPVGVRITGDRIQVSFTLNGQAETREYPLLTPKGNSQFRSFVGLIPFECLHHDSEINPRSIVDVEPMIEEFYSGNPQLQPSIATLEFQEPTGVGKIFLFDGQHKAAAQLYVGSSELLVRVFINADKSRLKQTNFRAHTKLAQIHFPQLVNDRVGADLFNEQFDRYVEAADTATHSEQSFFDSLDVQQRPEFRTYFQGYLRYEILTSKPDDSENRILDFVETVIARSTRYPLSYETIQRTFLSEFVFLKPAPQPLSETKKMRELEKANLIRLMNLFVDEVLANGRYDLSRGIYQIEETILSSPDSISDSHLRAYRLCRRAAMVIWCNQLGEAIRTLLKIRQRYSNPAWSKERPLWLEIQDADWLSVKAMLRTIRDHKLWAERTNREILRALTSSTQRDWHELLLEGRLPGRVEQLFPKLNEDLIFRAATSQLQGDH